MKKDQRRRINEEGSTLEAELRSITGTCSTAHAAPWKSGA
jgi:hypothetical protein